MFRVRIEFMIDFHKAVSDLTFDVLVHIGSQGCRVHGISGGPAGNPYYKLSSPFGCRGFSRAA